MNIDIRMLDKRDFGKAISFAITGMHFDRYTDVPWELKFIAGILLYMGMERST